ncbi:hypothetical protein D9M68_945650 [compost metagenome]
MGAGGQRDLAKRAAVEAIFVLVALAEQGVALGGRVQPMHMLEMTPERLPGQE